MMANIRKKDPDYMAAESIQKSNAGLRSIETESEAEGSKMEKRKIVRNAISIVAAILIVAGLIAGILFRHELKTLSSLNI